MTGTVPTIVVNTYRANTTSTPHTAAFDPCTHISTQQLRKQRTYHVDE